MLSYRDVAVDFHTNLSVVTVPPRRSKTGVFGRGATVYLARVEGTLCSSIALQHYITRQSPSPGPLVLSPDVLSLFHSILVTAMHSTLTTCEVRADGFNGHKFCIEAATAAAEVSLEDLMIQKLGRWKSDMPLQCTSRSHKLRFFRIPHAGIS